MSSILHSSLGLFVLAGPCVIESEEMCMTVAKELRRVCFGLGLSLVFKGSFDKANRSSAGAFRGLGMAGGLEVLAKIKRDLKLPVVTDVHESCQVEQVAKVVDVLQIPAFLARQTDLLTACGKTGRIVNVKKGQFMSPQEMKNAVEKVRSAGKSEVLLTERGTFFGYGRLVNDFGGLRVMASTGCPVVFDATHSTQMPAGLGNQSGGDPTLAPILARAAVVAGVDGLFIECHPEPAKALSDATSMLPLDQVEGLLSQCAALATLRKTWA